MSELEEKKRKLAEIRELHKPIRKSDIDNFMEVASQRYDEVQGRKQSENFKYVKPYQSPI